MNVYTLPKVELHAHLNGSLSNRTLMELHKAKYGNDLITSENYKIFEEDLLSMAHCFRKFKYAHDFTDSVERLALATRRVIEEFAAENTIYLELRSTPRANERMGKAEYVTTICETIRKCAEDHPQILVKFLPSIDRAQTTESNSETLRIVLEARNTYPDIITGLDLSGDPSSGDFNLFKPILKIAHDNGLKLAVHCAEITGRSEETREILQFGVNRIGHGTFLEESTDNWALVTAKGIFVECCLSSNVKCGTVPSYDQHHLQRLFATKNPIGICTDDYGVFDTSLSKEFEIAQKSFRLVPKDFESILKASVENAFCTEVEKDTLQRKIAHYFCSLQNQ